MPAWTPIALVVAAAVSAAAFPAAARSPAPLAGTIVYVTDRHRRPSRKHR